MTDTAALGTTVRPATAGDLTAIEDLLTRSGLPLDGVRDALPNFVVAQAGHEIVGVAGLELCCDNALLRSVAVADTHRSHGVGRALVTRVIADAEARGVSAVYLLTTTAGQYFPKFGFRPVTRDRVPDDVRGTWEFSAGCCSSAVVMCRECGRAEAEEPATFGG